MRHTLGQDPAAQLQAHLRSDERLLWCGVPDPRVWLMPADAFLIPFSILWCAFIVFWEFTAMHGGPLIAELWGIPLAAAAAYLTVGRFARKLYRKKRTVYGSQQTQAANRSAEI